MIQVNGISLHSKLWENFGCEKRSLGVGTSSTFPNFNRPAEMCHLFINCLSLNHYIIGNFEKMGLCDRNKRTLLVVLSAETNRFLAVANKTSSLLLVLDLRSHFDLLGLFIEWVLCTLITASYLSTVFLYAALSWLSIKAFLPYSSIENWLDE